MKPARHFAERLFARSLHDPPPSLDELERIFAECQNDAIADLEMGLKVTNKIKLIDRIRQTALDSWKLTCLHHTDSEREKASAVCPVCAMKELERMRGELEDAAIKKLKNT